MVNMFIGIYNMNNVLDAGAHNKAVHIAEEKSKGDHFWISTFIYACTHVMVSDQFTI